MNFLVYETTTGAIVRSGQCQDDMLDSQSRSGETAIEGEADDATQYVDSGVVSSRPTITATWSKLEVIANGSDTTTLGSSLPNPTEVFVFVPDGAVAPEMEIVTSGTFSFATPIVGSYTINVIPPFPYQPHTQIITAI
ncbi:hypothetical protein SAMN05216428_1146 [Nitrosospira sp. Nsp11]|uniref:hypothetical protein n=1 Tax=Nitrosospira sp. Nsp11 TaxID=1855338 RepID=UPI0009142169|nr:hypothetical protein [Nitrosospira sp. Nsp11]SHM10748.1 hypothetical protein SAMN05216428_1146 [Nitrosospira sp. Nsp11]